MKKTTLSKWQRAEIWAKGVTDKLGKPIDDGIFEAVVALHILGFYTTGSCEGHEAWGVGAPWIDVEFPGAMRAREKIWTLRKGKQTKRAIQQGEALVKKTRRSNLRVCIKLLELLDNFYRTRKVDAHVRLIINSWALGASRLENQGAETLIILPRAERLRKLRSYQKEMQAFTGFLKKRISI